MALEAAGAEARLDRVRRGEQERVGALAVAVGDRGDRRGGWGGREQCLDRGAVERGAVAGHEDDALDGETLRALLDGGAGAPSVTIVADRHGSGTNALVLAPPDVIEPGFGPGSFERHRERAVAAGAAWRSAALPALLLDIDTPEDLAALRAALPAGTSRTRLVLETIG